MGVSMLLSTLISAFIPVGVEGVKQAIDKWTGTTGVVATTVDDQIKLDNSEIERLKAVAALDNPGGTPSQWVVDLRASARYLGALTVIGLGIGSLFVGGVSAEIQTVLLEAANIAFGFLFGQRIVANFTAKK